MKVGWKEGITANIAIPCRTKIGLKKKAIFLAIVLLRDDTLRWCSPVIKPLYVQVTHKKVLYCRS